MNQDSEAAKPIRVRSAQNTKADLAAVKALMQETFDYHAVIAGDEPSLTFRAAAQTAYLEDCLWFVRRAAAGTSPQECALLACQVEQPGKFFLPSLSSLPSLLPHSASPANEKIVGFLMLRIQEDHFYSARYYGYIEQLIVTASARNLGVGSKLLQAACEWLRLRDIHTATLKVYGPNQDALRFYEREGFQMLRYELVKHF